MTTQALQDYLLGVPRERRQKEADYVAGAIRQNPLLYKKLSPVLKKLGEQLNMPYLLDALEPSKLDVLKAEEQESIAKKMGYEAPLTEPALLSRTTEERRGAPTPSPEKGPGVGADVASMLTQLPPVGGVPARPPLTREGIRTLSGVPWETPPSVLRGGGPPIADPVRGAPGSEAELTPYGRFKGLLDPLEQRLYSGDVSTFLREGEQFEAEQGMEQAALQVERLKMQSQISKWIADLTQEGKKFELDAAKAYGDAMAPIFAKTLSPTRGKVADVDMSFVSNIATIVLGAPDAFRRQQHLPAPVYDSSTGKIVWGTIGDILIESAVPGVRRKLGGGK